MGYGFSFDSCHGHCPTAFRDEIGQELHASISANDHQTDGIGATGQRLTVCNVQASASKNRMEKMQKAKTTASAPREIHPCVYSNSTRAGGNRSGLNLVIVLGGEG